MAYKWLAVMAYEWLAVMAYEGGRMSFTRKHRGGRMIFQRKNGGRPYNLPKEEGATV